MVKECIQYVETKLCLMIFYVDDLQCGLVGNHVRGEITEIANSVECVVNASREGFPRVGLFHYSVNLHGKVFLCVTSLT